MSEPTFQPNTEGVFYDVPAKVYHAAPGVSQSTLKAFDDAGSPLHFKTIKRKPPSAQSKPDRDSAAALQTLITNIMSGGVLDGKVLIHTSEAGGEAAFSIPQGFSPLDIAGLAQMAIDFVAQQPDPKNVVTTRRTINKLNFAFSRKNFGQYGGGFGSLPL